MGTDRILMFDTTLRDGEQGPGFSLHVDEKLARAHALDALGVDIMEAGFPIASRTGRSAPLHHGHRDEEDLQHEPDALGLDRSRRAGE